MKFEDAFNQAIDKMDADIKNKNPDARPTRVKKDTAKILSIMWNILAVAQNKLDDIVYIDDTMNIRSFPLSGDKGKKEPKGKKSSKSSNKKTAEDKDTDKDPEGPEVVTDGKEKEKQE